MMNSSVVSNWTPSVTIEEAVRRLRPEIAAGQLDPYLVSAFMVFAERAGLMSEAEDAFQPIWASEDESLGSHLAKAILRLHRRDYGQAWCALASLHEQFPRESIIFYWLAKVAAETGGHIYAIKRLRKVARLRPLFLWPFLDIMTMAFEHDNVRFISPLRSFINGRDRTDLECFPNTADDLSKYRVLIAWYKARRREDSDATELRVLADKCPLEDLGTMWLTAECLYSVGRQQESIKLFTDCLRRTEQARRLLSPRVRDELRSSQLAEDQWAHAVRGVDAYHCGDMSAARVSLLEAAGCFDTAPFLEILLARACAKTNDKKVAAEVYKRVLTRDPKNKTALQELCTLHFSGEGVPAEIATFCERYLIEAGDDIDILGNLYVIYDQGVKDPQRAMGPLTKAVSIAPERVDDAKVLVKRLLERRRYADALSICVRGTKMCPGLSWYHVQAASLLRQCGNEREAEKILLNAQKCIGPDDDNVKSLAECLMKGRAYQEAFDILFPYAERHPQDAHLFPLLLKCSLELPDDNPLAKVLATCLAEDERRAAGCEPTVVRGLAGRASRSADHTIVYYGGVVCAFNQQADLAVPLFARAAALAPTHARAHMHLGKLTSAHNRAAARPYFEKALELDPDNAETAVLLAALYGEQGLYDKGIDLIERYFSHCKDDFVKAIAIGNLTKMLHASGRTEDFEEIVEDLRASGNRVDLHSLGIGEDASSTDARIEQEFHDRRNDYLTFTGMVQYVIPHSCVTTIGLIDDSDTAGAFTPTCLVVLAPSPSDLQANKGDKSQYDKWRARLEEEAESVKIRTRVIRPEDVWQSAIRGGYTLVSHIASSRRMFDRDFSSVIAVLWRHKERVLQRFDKYVVCYVVGGSFKRGTGSRGSDVDVWLVFDDTDAQKDRGELKQGIHKICEEMVTESVAEVEEAKTLDFHVNTFLLTQFWDSLRSGNPIVTSFVADGAPLYDKGLFSPWKLLAQAGHLLSTPDLIEKYKNDGLIAVDQFKSQIIVDLRNRLIEPVIDVGRAILMDWGMPAPAPSQVASVLRSKCKQHMGDKLSTEDLACIDALCRLRTQIKRVKPDSLSAELLDESLSICQGAVNIFWKLMADDAHNLSGMTTHEVTPKSLRVDERGVKS